MEGKILPVQYPILNSYPSIAISSAIIMNNNNYRTWIATSYLLIKEEREKRQTKYFLAESEFNNPIEKKIYCIRDLSPKDIVEFIVTNINNNYYCKSYLDRYYVNSSKGHFLHSCFIYGYDKDNLYCGDFVGKDGKFSFFVIPQKFYIDSIIHSKSSFFANYIDTDNIYLYHLNNYILNDFTIEKLSLVDLLKKRYIECHNIYSSLDKFYCIYNKMQWLDWRPFSVLKDYVTAMKIRFEEIQRFFVFRNELDYTYLSKMNELVDNSLFLFYLNTRNKKDEYLLEIIKNLKELEEIDIYNIEYLLNTLGE